MVTRHRGDICEWRQLLFVNKQYLGNIWKGSHALVSSIQVVSVSPVRVVILAEVILEAGTQGFVNAGKA